MKFRDLIGVCVGVVDVGECDRFDFDIYGVRVFYREFNEGVIW